MPSPQAKILRIPRGQSPRVSRWRSRSQLACVRDLLPRRSRAVQRRLLLSRLIWRRGRSARSSSIVRSLSGDRCFRSSCPQHAFWDHNWVLHGIGDLLFRLLSRLGIATPIAAAGAVLYTVYPGHFEAIFWSSCIRRCWRRPTLPGFLAHLSWLESPSDQPPCAAFVSSLPPAARGRRVLHRPR